MQPWSDIMQLLNKIENSLSLSIAHPFTLVLPRFLLLSLFAILASSISGVEFPQLFQVFIQKTGKKNGELYYITVNFSTSVAPYGSESEDKSSFESQKLKKQTLFSSRSSGLWLAPPAVVCRLMLTELRINLQILQKGINSTNTWTRDQVPRL